jgi:hypothetical protein
MLNKQKMIFAVVYYLSAILQLQYFNVCIIR